ncbi:MAG: type II secretion system protein [Campylobacterota bacterium]|nr:type II secretion system protein [Campylobacterota bacterium]
MKKAFTLIELIFVIVIIGVLASVAVPKFSGLSDNSKISAELSTASSVQVALDACNGEWIINEGTFTCGASIASADLNTHGYPDSLGSPLDAILKNATAIGWTLSGGQYKGPASNSAKGASTCKTGKPCKTRHWAYNSTNGTFTLTDD